MASLLLFSDSECQVLAETLQTPTTCSAPFYISCAASWLQILDCPVREEGFLAIQMQSDASRSCRPVYGQIGGNVKYFVNQNCVGNELSVGVVPGTSTANTTVTIGVNESVATDTVLPAESKSSLSPPAVIGISIAAVIFTILVTAIIVVFLKKRKLSHPNRLRRKSKFDAASPDSNWKFPVIVKLESMDLLEKSLDGYDPVDTTSHIDLNFTDPDSITSIAPPEDSITSIAPPKDSIISIATPEESIVTQYKVLLDAAAKLAPQVNNLPNPHNLTTHLAIYHQGLLVKKLVKTFNSALETDSRLKPLYNHIWYGSDQLDFTFEWNYCKDQVQKRLYDIYKADMKEFVGIGQVFYEKYHLEKVNFIYTPLVKEVDGDIHQVLGGEETGTEYVSLIPGLTRGGKPLVTEILCPI